MSAKRQPRIEELARSVADDADVAWETYAHDESVSAMMPAFRIIASVAAAHREASPLTTAGDIAFRWGPLQVLERLGEGAFGEVFRAHDPRLQRDVALKLRHREVEDELTTSRLFLQEARRLARVRHRNVIVIHGADIHDGRAGLWTDYVAGPDLQVRLDEAGVLSVRHAIEIGVELAAALGAIHDADLVHGDVKPSNVLLDGDGVRLADFGAGSDVRATTSAMFGSPRFVAPELLDGDPPSPASDQYSLGVLLYRALSGSYPVEGSSFDEVRSAHARGSAKSFGDAIVARDDVPVALARVVDRALASDPRRRHADARAFGTALADAGTPPRNIPVFPTSFVGRVDDELRLAEAIAESALVTLTGSGGVGKTRLAAEYAATAAFADGAFWVDLAPLDAAGVPGGIRRALDAPIDIDDDVEAVAAFLKPRHVLLILDNGEHVLQSIRSFLARLERAGDRVRILMTSREPLRRDGERVVELSPLDVAEEAHGPAVQLFVDRARRASSEFELTARNKEAVRSVCAQLDGVPLAIELAAARTRSLDILDLERRLRDRGFSETVLADPNRIDRHGSMHAVIRWSLDLASAEERTLLARLSVFAGSWDLNAAETVCAGDGKSGTLDGAGVLEAHAGLVEKSLIATRESTHGGRYHLLQLVREYAGTLLSEEETHAVRIRERDLLTSRFRANRRELLSGDPSEPMRQFREQRENLLDVIAWFSDRGLDVEETGALANTAYRYWDRESRFREAAVACRRILGDGPLDRSRTHDWASFLSVVGTVETELRNFSRALDADRIALDILHENGNDRGVATMLASIAHIHMMMGDLDLAAGLAEEAIALAASVGDPRQHCRAYLNASAIADRRNDLEGAIAYGAEAKRLCHESGDVALMALIHLNEGRFLHRADRLDEARDAFDSAVEQATIGHEPRVLAFALCDRVRVEVEPEDWEPIVSWLGRAAELVEDLDNEDVTSFYLQTDSICALRRGDDRAALRAIRKSLAHIRDTNAPETMWSTFDSCGELALRHDDPAFAARCVGVAQSLADTFDHGEHQTPWERAHRSRVLRESEAVMGETDRDDEVAAGRALSWREAVARALRTTAEWLD